jgi:MFS family permease
MKRLRHLLAPLGSRDFTLLWLGQAISQLGDRCNEIAIIWLLIGLTGSSVVLGSVLTAMYIPTLLLLLFGGVLADRFSQRGVALVSDGLRALVIAAFAVVVSLNLVSLPMLFALAAFYGLVGAFFNPALSALFPSLVRAELYDSANVLRQVTLQSATLLGPALGGYLIAQWSVGAALGFDAATFAVSFLALSFMRRRRQGGETASAGAPKHRRGLRWSDLFGGVRFLAHEPGVLLLILFFSLTNGLNNVESVLVPRIARFELHMSANAFGLLASAMGAGTLLGALIIGFVAPRIRRRAQLICLSMTIFGAAIVAMGLADRVLVLDAAYFVLGLTFIVPEVVFGTLLQRIIPLESRGRVFSVIGLISMSMNPLGFLLAGYLGDTFGPRAGLLLGGGVIAALSVLALLVPAVRRLNSRVDSIQPGTDEAAGVVVASEPVAPSV